MLTRDPFRHLDPPRRPRRALPGILAAVGVSAALAAVFAGLATANPAATRPDPWPATVAHDATHAVAGFTPSATPITHGLASRAATGHYRAR